MNGVTPLILLEVNMEQSIYYDIDKTLSKQRLFNFVVGPRGVGKTYGFKRRVIQNFLKKGEQFVYLRRYDTEMPSSKMRNYFDDIADEFPDHEFISHNGLFRIDKEIAGWYFPLTKAIMLKSIPFPNVSLIGFDEFIIATGTHHYLPKEVTSFLECYSTISRDRDITAIFMANAITITNPYFIYFNISLPPGRKIMLYDEICIEYVDSPAFEEHMRKTRFGKIISGTTYGDYAINNDFLLDSEDFIRKMDEPCASLCNFLVNGKQIGFYKGSKTGLFYLSDKPDQTNRTFSLNIDDHNDKTTFIKKSNMYVLNMIDSFSVGDVRFTNINVKNICYDVLRGFM